jgi:hypothetical protein
MVTVPWALTACNSTMEWPAASATDGMALTWAASVVRGALRVSPRFGAAGCSSPGESRTTTQATAARAAVAPTRIMIREWWGPGERIGRSAANPAATSLG